MLLLNSTTEIEDLVNNMEIVLATSNPHKVEEINAITKPYGITFILPPKGFDPIETGKNFEENSLIKAQCAYELTHKMVLADDSGLCVDFLNGEPGIYSARYAETPAARIKKLLNNMKDAPKDQRGAKFVCAMTLLDKDGKISLSTRGECFGEISTEAKGSNGFGYDPVFIVEEHNGLTMAELSEDEKNRISHRARALNNVIEHLNKLK